MWLLKSQAKMNQILIFKQLMFIFCIFALSTKFLMCALYSEPLIGIDFQLPIQGYPFVFYWHITLN